MLIQKMHLKVVHHLANIEQKLMILLLMRQNVNIAMPLYNLIEYTDNYSDTSESLWQFKRDEIKRNVNLIIMLNRF